MEAPLTGDVRGLDIPPGYGKPEIVAIDSEDGKLNITVHNIGNLVSKPFACEVFEGDAETGKLISKARLRAVPHATLSIEAKMGIVKGPQPAGE